MNGIEKDAGIENSALFKKVSVQIFTCVCIHIHIYVYIYIYIYIHIYTNIYIGK